MVAEFDRLLAESESLEVLAAKVQQGQQTGVSDAELRELRERYRRWYAQALAALPEDLKDRFRQEYEGKWHSQKIRAFLENPSEPNPLGGSAQDSEVFPYWTHPFDSCFWGPLEAQRVMLEEANLRPGAREESAADLIETVCSRLPTFIREARKRYGHRAPLIDVKDEHDLTDLLRAILRMFFADVREEEWTPSYAGGSARMDLLLKIEQIVVEGKRVSAQRSPKTIADELLVDISRYQSHPDCKALVAVIYDPDFVIGNPAGLEADLSAVGDPLPVTALVVQG